MQLAPKPLMETLPNGLSVWVSPQLHLQSASVSLFVKVGPRYERAETNGISHFLEHMLFRGTPRYETAYALTYAAESIGGSLDAATHADFTHYQISVPAEHTLPALELLSELVSGPRFTELALEKQIVREEILADLDDEGREVDPDNLSRFLVFGATHPLGFKITGDASNVDRFGIADLRRHLDAHYGASNMALVATGAVDAGLVFERARELFGGLSRGRLTLLEAPPPPRERPRVSFVHNDSSQSDVRLCLRTSGADDPAFTALKLLARLLDDGMSTRLHRRLTDDTGLAYDSFAALDTYEEIGVMEIGASVEHEKVPEVVRTVLELLTELRDGEIAEAELEKARVRYRFSLRSIVDSPDDMALYVGTEAIFGRRADLEALMREVDAVTVPALKAVARRLVRAENLYVLSVGKHTRAREKETQSLVELWCRANGAT